MKTLKLIPLILIPALLLACSKDRSTGGGRTLFQGGVDVGNMGGVDVGNMNGNQGGTQPGRGSTVAIPRTEAFMFIPTAWAHQSSQVTVSARNSAGSEIKAGRGELPGLSSPSPAGLQGYLKARHPGRDYKSVIINGLEGVRADLVKTNTEVKSDIYLVTETMNVIHIQADLKEVESGITAGEQILNSVRVRYRGVPVRNSQPRTVTLIGRNQSTVRDRHAYELLRDCFAYLNCEGGGGVAIAYEGEFYIGTAGADHGRIVELGPESEIPFDRIRVEGDYLVAPRSRVALSDIYTTFSRGKPEVEIDRIQLKPGYVYLVRTIAWPREDMVTKIRVDRLIEGREATITYQKLVTVQPEVLQRQVEEMNAYTRTVEMPRNEGEVTLYNRSHFKNYYFASFNFQYATSGNYAIVGNSWDLTFGQNCEGHPSLTVPHTSSALGFIVDLGQKHPAAVTTADFPDANSFRPACGTRIEVGKTYGVRHLKYDDDNAASLHGAIKVLEMGPQNQWVRLQFRRISMTAAPEFQAWISEGIPSGVQTVTLEVSGSDTAFSPFGQAAGRTLHSFTDRIRYYPSNGSDRLSWDSRPYGRNGGIVKVNRRGAFEGLRFEDVESFKGQFMDYIDLRRGDILAIRAINYGRKTVLVARVDSVRPGRSITLSLRYMYRARAPFVTD